MGAGPGEARLPNAFWCSSLPKICKTVNVIPRADFMAFRNSDSVRIVNFSILVATMTRPVAYFTVSRVIKIGHEQFGQVAMGTWPHPLNPPTTRSGKLHRLFYLLTQFYARTRCHALNRLAVQRELCSLHADTAVS